MRTLNLNQNEIRHINYLYKKGEKLVDIAKITGLTLNKVTTVLSSSKSYTRKKKSVIKSRVLVDKINEMLDLGFKPSEIYKELSLSRQNYHFLMKKYNKVKIQDEE